MAKEQSVLLHSYKKKVVAYNVFNVLKHSQSFVFLSSPVGLINQKRDKQKRKNSRLKEYQLEMGNLTEKPASVAKEIIFLTVEKKS